jgi:uncharacterized phage protein (TIGR01671 family)
MKQIIFRAKRIDMDRWVYGQYFISPLTDENSGEKSESGWFFLSGIDAKPHHIIVQNNVAFSIDPNTLGQYIEINDEDGNMVYENDIVRTVEETISKGDLEIVGIVDYAKELGAYIINFPQYGTSKLLNDFIDIGIEVIGNETDNPEIMEKLLNE